jgi:hypothetical protein
MSDKIAELEKEIKSLLEKINDFYIESQKVDEYMALDILPEIDKKKVELNEKLKQLTELKTPKWGDSEFGGGKRSKRKSSKRKSSTRRKTAKRKSSKKTRK